jgi:hypothetical protein
VGAIVLEELPRDQPPFKSRSLSSLHLELLVHAARGFASLRHQAQMKDNIQAIPDNGIEVRRRT